MTSNDVTQIGRQRNPAERSLANALERPEAAEYHARCLYQHEQGGDWGRLSEEDRSTWIATAIEMMRNHAREWSHPVPPGPPAGEELDWTGAA